MPERDKPIVMKGSFMAAVGHWNPHEHRKIDQNTGGLKRVLAVAGVAILSAICPADDLIFAVAVSNPVAANNVESHPAALPARRLKPVMVPDQAPKKK